jgi:hypothetical protein
MMQKPGTAQGEGSVAVARHRIQLSPLLCELETVAAIRIHPLKNFSQTDVESNAMADLFTTSPRLVRKSL